jgi:hypothetical protein
MNKRDTVCALIALGAAPFAGAQRLRADRVIE